jgi:thioredoxin-related protein
MAASLALTKIRAVLAAVWIALAMASGAHAQVVAPDAIDILPPWFVETFFDFQEDIADAAKDRRRLLVYFGQDGCPYCRQLMVNNFSQQRIVEKTRAHFVAIALNIWGDREIKWVDGRAMPEKDLARLLKVQFTPTLLFFDERGEVIVRLDGYYPPQRFEAVLDYVAARRENGESLGDYLARTVRETASPALHDEPFFMRPPYDLRRKAGGKPLAVLFETADCPGCDELHREAFRRPEILALLERFDVARFALGAPTALTTPSGAATTAQAWARTLGVAYTPTVVFFDTSDAEVFRISAYLRPFHLAGSLQYVADGGYRSEPSFQRYLQRRADQLRARGEEVNLWR